MSGFVSVPITGSIVPDMGTIRKDGQTGSARGGSRCRAWTRARLCRHPPAGDLKARDTRGKPQHPGGVPTDHVAEVVHAAIEPTEPKGQGQKRPTEEEPHLHAPPSPPT